VPMDNTMLHFLTMASLPRWFLRGYATEMAVTRKPASLGKPIRMEAPGGLYIAVEDRQHLRGLFVVRPPGQYAGQNGLGGSSFRLPKRLCA
jgi:hypothetical protein